MRYFSHKGFSLVELTVVLLLITLIGSVAVRETSELAFQARYEQTKERLEMIKQAILGNPRQIINGQQAISGFVADMGRLPVNLHELLEREYCSDRTYATKTDCTTNGATWIVAGPPYDTSHCTVAGYFNKADCETNSGIWVPNFAGMAVGWHGPYLAVNQNATNADAFPDAWANQATVATDHNYGWRFDDLFAITAIATDAGNLIIQSQGKNQQLDNSIPAVEDYDTDYPSNLYQSGTTYYPKPATLQKDWLVNISGGISVNLLKKVGSSAYCGFSGPATNFTTEQACKNAGGSWSGTCSLNVSSCKSVGGKWKSCFLTPAACADVGGVASLKCQFTETACTAVGGTWTAASNACNLTTPPATKNDCALAGGAWIQDCSFLQAKCEATPTGGTHAVGTWEPTAPASCSFGTLNDCDNVGGRASNIVRGQSTGDECYMSHANFSGNQYTPDSCQAALGKWTQPQICALIFHRQNGQVVVSKSDPVELAEGNGFQTVLFSFPGANQTDCVNNNGFWDGSRCNIAVGQHAIGIYEYDGTCSPNNPLYPADRQIPIQVDFHPHTTLPVINW